MNIYKRKLSKRNKHQSKSNKLSQLKSEIQKEQRKAYWNYIENMIFDIPVPEQDSTKINKHPKNMFSYIKTQKTETSTIPPLRENGLLKSDPKTKSNILNNQFQKAFTPVTSDKIPNKGPSPHPKMTDILVTQSGVNKLLSNINPHKASGQMASMLRSEGM